MKDHFIRDVNIELLRVVSMLMILTLHYLGNGKILSLTPVGGGLTYYVLWTVEAICLISVNCYMMISGYFLSQKEFTWRRIISFYSQILFYTIVLTTVCLIFGIDELSLENLIYVIPVMSRKNWYVTAYFCLLFLMPVLNYVIQTFEREKMRKMLIVQFVLFSVMHTLFFYTDTFHLASGYSVWWYTFVYFVGGYYRKYSIHIDRKCYLASLLILLLPFSKFLMDHIGVRFSTVSGYGEALYNYNSFPVFAVAICLFDLFVRRIHLQFKCTEKIIFFLAKTSFAVFYIHTFVLLRDWLWLALGSEKFIGSGMVFLHMVASVCLVYLVCTVIEYCRLWFFYVTGIDKYVVNVANYMDEHLPLA